MIAEHALQAISPLVNYDAGMESQEVLEGVVGVFAVILMALSLSAYRKTHLRRLVIVSGAFALFAVEVVIRQLDAFVFAVGYQTDQIVSTALEVLILLLFFLAVITKN